jgi:hypothetical protein
MRLWSFDTSQSSNHVVEFLTTAAVRLHPIGSRLVIGSSTLALGNRPRSTAQRAFPEPSTRNADGIRRFIVGQALLPSVPSQPPAAMGSEKQPV